MGFYGMTPPQSAGSRRCMAPGGEKVLTPAISIDMLFALLYAAGCGGGRKTSIQ
jgi:hypothetical protein